VAEFDDFLETLKKAAAALRDPEVPFLLGGGVAAWARGGPESNHDLDLMVKPEDAERAVRALADAGFRIEDPPEGWLYKAWDGDVLVDVIFEPSGGPVDDTMFERAEELDVAAVAMNVMSLEDVMVTKLLSLREHELDYESVLEIAARCASRSTGTRYGAGRVTRPTREPSPTWRESSRSSRSPGRRPSPSAEIARGALR
jgi:hypothetical protein